MSRLEDHYLEKAVKAWPPEFNGTGTAWRSPSNIALVKYWGKRSGQVPQNPSLSFSLSRSVTETRIYAMIGRAQTIPGEPIDVRWTGPR